MTPSFFFYDLETSGLRPTEARIMQFAGQRTDMNLNLVGEPVNRLIKLTPDVLPEPDAIVLTGITPKQTIEGGISEADFLEFFYEEVATPGTIFVGFNNVRFDDEFMRFLNYRNFYDPYIWQWKDNRGRWDILDLVRMTRALRPEGIIWPFNKDNKPVNRLELLTKANGLEHTAAHDALSDVQATINVAKLIHDKQPKLFKYAFSTRSKDEVAKIVLADKPFVYTSSHYSADYWHTTAVMTISAHPMSGAALVYDLRHDPSTFLAMSSEELAEAWKYNEDKAALRLPVKTLKFNRVPAIAPMSVISDKSTEDRLGLRLDDINKNLKLLKDHQMEFAEKLAKAINVMDKVRDEKNLRLDIDADGSLYTGGFIGDSDRNLFPSLHATSPYELDEFRLKFQDSRLKKLLPLYKARNYPSSLNPTELKAWQDYCHDRINSGGKSSRLNKYLARLDELGSQVSTKKRRELVDELKAYAESAY